ncbi:MAG: hypothetical protein ACK4TO_09340 [Candidatus Nitrosotenuis sp.]
MGNYPQNSISNSTCGYISKLSGLIFYFSDTPAGELVRDIFKRARHEDITIITSDWSMNQFVDELFFDAGVDEEKKYNARVLWSIMRMRQEELAREGKFVEVGLTSPLLDSSLLYVANVFLTGTPQEIWQSHWLADISTGTTYTFEYEDDDGDYIWDARLNGVSKIQKIVSWSRGTRAMTGAEIDDDAVIIPKTQLTSIQHHTGTSWSNWSSANGGFGTIPSPNTEIYIRNHSTTPYQSICVATSSISACP